MIMNPEYMTPVKCNLCGEPLGVNNMYPGGLCEHCFWSTSLTSNRINELMFKENNRHVLTTKQELNNLYGYGGFVKEEDDGRATDI